MSLDIICLVWAMVGWVTLPFFSLTFTLQRNAIHESTIITQTSLTIIESSTPNTLTSPTTLLPSQAPPNLYSFQIVTQHQKTIVNSSSYYKYFMIYIYTHHVHVYTKTEREGIYQLKNYVCVCECVSAFVRVCEFIYVCTNV